MKSNTGKTTCTNLDYDYIRQDIEEIIKTRKPSSIYPMSYVVVS